jgi:fibronectin type III domain protein
MSARVIRWVLFSVACLQAACGHDVAPTTDYSKPENIPVCCTSDPTARCCGLTAYPFSRGIDLSWNVEDPIFSYIDGWLVYRAVGESEPPDSAYRRLFSEPYTYSAYRDDQITDGVRYWYRLTSVSPAGVESLPTLPAGVRADFTPPNVPTGLAASVTSTQVVLQWNASTASDLDHYNVFREPRFPPLVFPRAYVANYLDRTVKPDSTYRYWVTAVDQGLNESAPSETVEVTVPPAAKGSSR